jgi:hypothetical protein
MAMERYLPSHVENIFEKGTPVIQSGNASFFKKGNGACKISWSSVRNGESNVDLISLPKVKNFHFITAEFIQHFRGVFTKGKYLVPGL